jgi:hypothetical protein
MFQRMALNSAATYCVGKEKRIMQTRKETTNLNPKKLFACTLLLALMLSAAAISMASAAEEDEPNLIAPPPTVISDRASVPEENQATYSPGEDSVTTTSEDIVTSDQPVRSGEDVPLNPPVAVDQDENATSLISTLDSVAEEAKGVGNVGAGPDYTIAALGAAAFAAAVAMCAVVVVVRRRKAAVA